MILQLHMFTVASMAILVTMTLALIRAMLGPTVFDRVQKSIELRDFKTGSP